MGTVKDAQDPIDPRGLIRESYRIDGITEAECRTIFLDWALGFPMGEDTSAAVADLLDRYAAAHPDHPMTGVLRAGTGASLTGRRGGRRGRLG